MHIQQIIQSMFSLIEAAEATVSYIATPEPLGNPQIASELIGVGEELRARALQCRAMLTGETVEQIETNRSSPSISTEIAEAALMQAGLDPARYMIRIHGKVVREAEAVTETPSAASEKLPKFKPRREKIATARPAPAPLAESKPARGRRAFQAVGTTAPAAQQTGRVGKATSKTTGNKAIGGKISTASANGPATTSAPTSAKTTRAAKTAKPAAKMAKPAALLTTSGKTAPIGGRRAATQAAIPAARRGRGASKTG